MSTHQLVKASMSLLLAVVISLPLFLAGEHLHLITTDEAALNEAALDEAAWNEAACEYCSDSPLTITTGISSLETMMFERTTFQMNTRPAHCSLAITNRSSRGPPTLS